MNQDDSDEVDRRISAAEIRIKLWVVASVLAHMITLFFVAVPAVFYLGQIDSKLVALQEKLEVRGN